MLELILSIFLFVIAPFIYTWAARYGRAWITIETLISISIVGLVALHLIPESIHYAGFNSVGFAFVGLILPSALERLWHKAAPRVHMLSVVFSMLGLVIHGMMDGAALAIPSFHDHHHHGSHDSHVHLPLAVLLHRLPVGLFIWSYLRPQGLLKPVFVLSLISLSTIIGYGLAGTIVHQLDNQLLAYFQALVAGSLLHIVFDKHT